MHYIKALKKRRKELCVQVRHRWICGSYFMDPAARWVYVGKSQNSDFYFVPLILLCGTSLVTHTHTRKHFSFNHKQTPSPFTQQPPLGAGIRGSVNPASAGIFSLAGAPSVSRRLSLFISHHHRLLSPAARQPSLPLASLRPPSTRSLLGAEAANNQASVRRRSLVPVITFIYFTWSQRFSFFSLAAT